MRGRPANVIEQQYTYASPNNQTGDWEIREAEFHILPRRRGPGRWVLDLAGVATISAKGARKKMLFSTAPLISVHNPLKLIQLHRL